MPANERPLTRWDTGRVEAFSDGVFAIAITLLVLEISVDPGDFDHLGSALLDLWPSYLAYVTSFLTVGVCGSPTTTCSRACASSIQSCCG
jgi:hypothetical protein